MQYEVNLDIESYSSGAPDSKLILPSAITGADNLQMNCPFRDLLS